MNRIVDTETKIRKLLIQIQRKGELACQQFLDCLETMFPGTNQDLQHSQWVFLLEGLNQESQTLQSPEQGEKSGFNPQLELDSQQAREPEETDLLKGKGKAFQELLRKLELQEHLSRKFRLSDVLEISQESLKNGTPETFGDLPRHFLKKVTTLNMMARNTSLVHRATDDKGGSEEKQSLDDILNFSDIDTRVSLHLLDVLCAVLLCSDSFLQQEILSKMSVCQFALPLLLPALDTPKCTLMLWAMRDIVRKWRLHSLAESKGFREESLVLMSLPTISFVRLGSCSFSKSKLLNEVLSPSQQHQDFFIH
ncbi:metastasis-associated protein MTA1 [Platysternon megacephalum]|uniref:Metastasis-associated protein MTA1 n=1 Tax=Platysternon megacephalum TaxID=55544 RepID=A0A4D9DXF6_9SAUR|nr:metastasis-associated protein MTA1 [Platysternon megacephalum]